MNKRGYIKIDRKILDWRWYTDPNTFRVFIHLLLTANFKDQQFEGYTIKAGQVQTTYQKLALTLFLTLQNTRTAINHLKSTGEITVSRQSNFLLITLVNYKSYQCRPTDRLTSGQQTANRPLTDFQHQYKKEKNVKNVKEVVDKNAHARTRARESAPTAAEINSFILENSLSVDGDRFLKYYTAIGWKDKVGNSILPNWQTKLLDWDKSERPKENTDGYAAYDLKAVEKMIQEEMMDD